MRHSRVHSQKSKHKERNIWEGDNNTKYFKWKNPMEGKESVSRRFIACSTKFYKIFGHVDLLDIFLSITLPCTLPNDNINKLMDQTLVDEI
jgi:hypothetical protein